MHLGRFCSATPVEVHLGQPASNGQCFSYQTGWGYLLEIQTIIWMMQSGADLYPYSWGGKSNHILYSSSSSDTFVKNTIVKEEVVNQLLYLSESGQLQALKHT